MKKILRLSWIIGVLLLSQQAFGQDWGIGVRFGDPSGISIKHYLSQEKALELSIGRTRVFSGNGHPEKRLRKWYESRFLDYKDFQYLDRRYAVPIGIQLHYLIHNDFSKIGNERISGLDWYYGFGGQVRLQQYRFNYRYKTNGSSNWFYVSDQVLTDVDVGVDAVIGLEYTFEDAPISLFIDATLFMEIFDSPFLFWIHGGIGGRFNF